MSCRIAIAVVVLHGFGCAAPVAPVGATPPVRARSAPTVPDTPVEPPAPEPPIEITVVDRKLACGEPDRCAGEVRFDGTILLPELPADARVTYGEHAGMTAAEALAAVAAAGSPEELVDERGIGRGPSTRRSTDVVGHMPLTIEWADGTRAAGTVPVERLAAGIALDRYLAGVAKGPVMLAGDEREPAPARPRAMWAAGSRVLRGQADRATQIDWVLVIEDQLFEFACPDGRTRTARNLAAAVYQRRTGDRVDRRVFPPDPEELRMACRGEGALTTLEVIHRPMIDWAWDTVRKQHAGPTP